MKTQPQRFARLFRNSGSLVTIATVAIAMATVAPLIYFGTGQDAAAASLKSKANSSREIPTLQSSLIAAGSSRKQCVELPYDPSSTGSFNRTTGIATFEAQTGTTATCVLEYNNGADTWAEWSSPWYLQPYAGDVEWVASAPETNQMVLQVNLIPDGLQNINDPLGWEQSCAAGQFDTYAKQLGINLVNSGLGNSVIRLGAEMNGPWESDFVGTTTTEQSLWATCFANEVTAMRQVAGEHFLFDWNPNACYENIPYNNFYPGNSFVDIVGLDFYDGSCLAPSNSTTPLSWTQLSNLPAGLTSFEAFAQQKGKPMSFPEWGLLEHPNGDDPAYINGVGATFASQNFSFEAYFDSNDDGTLPIGSSTPLSLEAFQKWFG